MWCQSSVDGNANIILYWIDFIVIYIEIKMTIVTRTSITNTYSLLVFIWPLTTLAYWFSQFFDVFKSKTYIYIVWEDLCTIADHTIFYLKYVNTLKCPLCLFKISGETGTYTYTVGGTSLFRVNSEGYVEAASVMNYETNSVVTFSVGYKDNFSAQCK